MKRRRSILELELQAMKKRVRRPAKRVDSQRCTACGFVVMLESADRQLGLFDRTRPCPRCAQPLPPLGPRAR